MILLIVGVSIIKQDSALEEAKEWATNNGYVIKQYDTHQTIMGTPFFYVGKGQIIVEMNVLDRAGSYHKIWMRTGTFNNDFIQE
jgi:hypothetical protein